MPSSTLTAPPRAGRGRAGTVAARAVPVRALPERAPLRDARRRGLRRPVHAGTSARPSGTWPTRAGSLRRSCSSPSSRATCPSTPSTNFCSTPTTTPSASGTAGPSAALFPVPRSPTPMPIARPWTGTWMTCCRRGGRRAAGAPPAPRHHRPAPRAAAPGTDGDGHQTRLLREPPAARLPGPAPGRRGECAAADLAGVPGAAGVGRAMTGAASRSTTQGPRHREFVPAFALASRLVTCGEYQNFMADGGYRRPEFWLSAGWNTVQTEDWQAPLYWEQQDGQWWQFTLGGMRPVGGRRTGLPRLAVRGRRLHALGRGAARHGVRVGGRRAGPPLDW